MRADRMYGNYTSETFVTPEGLQRRCVFCGEIKPLVDNFAKNGTNPDGSTAYRQDCKVCYNIRRAENKSKSRHSNFLGGQRRRGDEPDFTHQQWKEAVIFFGGECAYCGGSPRRGQKLTRDHLEAFSKGGTTIASNIVPACNKCNCSKGSSDFKEWFMKQDFFSQERLNKIFKWRTIQRMLGD